MKRLFIILALTLFSCSSDSIGDESTETETCYRILSVGEDDRGDFIIVKISDFNNRRYSVDDYQYYIGRTQICDLTNLTEQGL